MTRPKSEGSRRKQAIVDAECRKIEDKALRSFCRNVISRYTSDPDAASLASVGHRINREIPSQANRPASSVQKGFFMRKMKK